MLYNVNIMMRYIIKPFDLIFTSTIVRGLILILFGYRWNGWFLSIIGYRASYMVNTGETCIIAGVFSEDTVRLFSRAVGDAGRVIIVEANPSNVDRLKNNLASLANVTVVNRAVWRCSGEMEFLLSGQHENQAYNRIDSPEIQKYPNHMNENPVTIKVKTDSLDDIASKLDVKLVHHLNLTINGAELQALDGISNILKVNPSLRIYINSETPDPAQKTIEKLHTQRFKVFVSNMTKTKNKKISLVRIYAIGNMGKS